MFFTAIHWSNAPMVVNSESAFVPRLPFSVHLSHHLQEHDDQETIKGRTPQDEYVPL